MKRKMWKDFWYILLCSTLITACQTPNISNITNQPPSQLENKIKIETNKFEDIYGNYKLSNNFIKKLNDFSLDKVLNKDEINNLIENGSKTEKTFIELIKNKESFNMTNFKINDSYPEELNFIINKDFSVTGEFIQKISSKILDDLLDKNEIDNLIIDSNLEEKAFLEKIISYDGYNYFPFIDENNKINEKDLKIYYDEKQIIPGDSILEVLSNIGQSDRLKDTYTDEIRCGAGVIINSVLLTKGQSGFYDLSKKLELNLNSLTYENVHLMQDKLMKKVNESKGLSIFKNSEQNILEGGTLFDALKIADPKWNIEAVEKINGSFEDDINHFFKINNNGVIILTGYFDKSINKMIFNKGINHSSLLSFKDNKFIITDTSGRNGTGVNNKKLNNNDLQEIYSSNQIFLKVFSSH